MKEKDNYKRERWELGCALLEIFGDAFQGEWWKQKCDLRLGNFYPKIANCKYRIKVISHEVEVRDNGNKKAPEQIRKLIETLVREHFASKENQHGQITE